MDDPRNTDNAWIETVAISIHFPDQSDVELNKLNMVRGSGHRLRGGGISGPREGSHGLLGGEQPGPQSGGCKGETGAQRVPRGAQEGPEGTGSWLEWGQGWVRTLGQGPPGLPDSCTRYCSLHLAQS